MIAAQGSLHSVSDQAWQVQGIGDFDGDGKADILWHNVSTGDGYIYLMNGMSIASEGFTRTVADTRWHPTGQSTPVSLAQVEVQQTLSAGKSIINAKGTALDYTDLQPLYDSANFLNDGFDWIFDSGSITDLLRRVTVQHLARGKLVAYDAANRIISVTATMVDGQVTQGNSEVEPWKY